MTSSARTYSSPTIALVGRPNVGKSTLFNRLIGWRKAVVSSIRGTTRDRIHGTLTWRKTVVTLIDTGGLELDRREGLEASVQRHVHRALEEAQGFVLVCDAQEGLVPADEMILEQLRTTGKPILVAVNKLDGTSTIPPEFFSLGIPHVLGVSALHGRGTGELLDAAITQCEPIVSEVPAPDGSSQRMPPDDVAAMAIIGRQNVGKSSLFNTLLREERAIVSERPGTTRDAVDTLLTVNGVTTLLIDTAGLRHRRKVRSPIDLFSMARTTEAIARCHVALVVLDATQGVTNDDRRIINLVCEAGCGLVLLANKWDLVKGGSERKLQEAIKRILPSASFAPVLPVSAKTGFNVAKSFAMAQRVHATIRRGVSETICIALLHKAWASHLPPRMFGRAIRLKGARWIPDRPPRVELTTIPMGRLPIPYQHYLLKQLHAHPGFTGVPIKLVITSPTRH